MDNDTPKIDQRTSGDFVEQAKNLIPQFTPEYTNFNDSDPGMTLVKVHAWLTETLLFQLNQLPQQNYDKFIDLLGVKPNLATSANTEVAFNLKKTLGAPGEPLVVNVPIGAKIEVDDPELDSPIVFETDRSLSAVNAAIGAVIVPQPEHTGYSLKTEYNAKTAQVTVTAPFEPFATVAGQNQGMYLGLVLRPHQKLGNAVDYLADRWPECEINLTLAASESANEYVSSDQHLLATSHTNSEAVDSDNSANVEWAYYSGGIETDIFTDQDNWVVIHPEGEGMALDRSGHVSARLPAAVPLIRFDQMPRSVWSAIGALRPPTNHQELLDDIEGEEPVLNPSDISDAQWLSMFPAVDDDSIYDDLLNEIKACCSEGAIAEALLNFSHEELTLDEDGIVLDSSAIKDIAWLELAPQDYGMPSLATTGMIWLRVKAKTPDHQAKVIDSLYFNTVSASAKETFRSQKLGESDGKPNQIFKLPRTPLLFDTLTQQPLLSIISIENNTEQAWQWAVDFYQAGSESLLYTFDAQTQSIQFGDGIFGAIPNAGAQIYVKQMQVGGGLAANVGRFTLTKLKRAVSHVDSVTNPLPAFGGRDTESFKQTRLRAAHEIKHRDRAVTADDFAELACQTPTVPIHAAYALANTAVISRQISQPFEHDNGEPFEQQLTQMQLISQSPGAVTVVVLPKNDDPEPYPSESEIKAVCCWLNPRRLITTELFVIGPQYRHITLLQLNVSIDEGFDISQISRAVQSRLLQFFHPVTGGKAGDGWPFGEDVYFSDIFCQILAIKGVSRAYNLLVEIDGVVESQDRIIIEGQQLMAVKADAMNIKVDYEF